MNNHNNNQLESFKSLIEPWFESYQIAEISYVSVKEENQYYLLSGRVIFLTFPNKEKIQHFEFESDHIKAGRYQIHLTSSLAEQVLEKLMIGEIREYKGSYIPLKRDRDLNVSYSQIRHPFVVEGLRVPNIFISGMSRHYILSKMSKNFDIDWELKAASTPFENIDDLLKHCFLPLSSETGDPTFMEVVATSPIIFNDQSVISNGVAIIKCNASIKLRNELVDIGYKLLTTDGSVEQRNRINGNQLKWSEQNGYKIAEYEIQVNESNFLQAFVSYSGVAHHQWWVVDPNKRANPRHAIHQIFDDELEILKRHLFKPETDKAHLFEQAVSVLFYLRGFSVGNYGRIPKLQKGPDIIALSISGNVAVVECTLGLINENDKLAKLVQRVKLVKDKLILSGIANLQIQPVVVTPLSRQEIYANLEEAGKYGIAVLCKEDIEEMISQISFPLNSDKLFDEAKNLIPTFNSFKS